MPKGNSDVDQMLSRNQIMEYASKDNYDTCVDIRIPKQLLFGELTTGTRTVGRPLLRWKNSLKDTLKQSTSPQLNGKTPQLIVAHGGDQFMADSFYTITLGERERGMPPSELVVVQIVMRHHQHHRTPTCVDTVREPAVAATGS